MTTTCRPSWPCLAAPRDRRSGCHRYESEPAIPAARRVSHPRVSAARAVAGCAHRRRREEVDELSPGDVERGPRFGKTRRNAFDGVLDLVDRRLQICTIHLKSSSANYSTAARFPSCTLFVSSWTPATCLLTQARYAVCRARSSDRARTRYRSGGASRPSTYSREDRTGRSR